MGVHPEGRGKVGCFRTVAAVVVPVLAAVTLFTCEWGASSKAAGLERPTSFTAEESAPPRRPSVCTVTVPNVLGLDEQAAKDALAAKGLSAYVWANKEGGGTWTVILQVPVAGTSVNRCTDPVVEIWIDQ